MWCMWRSRRPAVHKKTVINTNALRFATALFLPSSPLRGEGWVRGDFPGRNDIYFVCINRSE